MTEKSNNDEIPRFARNDRFWVSLTIFMPKTVVLLYSRTLATPTFYMGFLLALSMARDYEASSLIESGRDR